MTTTCKNCNQNFKGHYCNNCGQSANTKEITSIYLWHEIVHGILHLDNGILYTTIELFSRPGFTIREYIEGKRVRHFKPVAYIFILSTLYALLAHFLNVGIFVDEIIPKIPDIGHHKVMRILQMILNIFIWFRDHYAYSTLLFLPAFSLSTYLAFRKNNYSYLKTHGFKCIFGRSKDSCIYCIFTAFYNI